MPEVILMLFKINLVLLLFAAAYYLVLRRLTFYTVNRAFLAVGIIFSTIYPFINLTEFFNRQEQLNPNVVALVPTIDVNKLIDNYAIINYWEIVMVLFYLGVAVMAIRLTAQFASLYRVHQRSTPGAIRNLNVRILNGKVSPFSFWQTVYVNPAIHSASELDTILAHEQIHVKEWHTLDIILAEISVVFYWFNPGVWLMKRAIKENIEFITDAKIVKKGMDKKAYQYSLLGVGNLQASVALVNNFNISDLKKRIKMMNAKRSSPKKLIIYALILPVLLITTLAFTVNKKEVSKQLLPLTKALDHVSLFSEPADVKIEPPVVKSITKRKSNLKLSYKLKRDTVMNIRYIVNLSSALADTPRATTDLLELERFRRNDQIISSFKGVMRGVKLGSEAISYTPDSISKRRTGAPKVENISITLRKTGNPLPNQDETKLNEIVVVGYRSKMDNVKDSTRTLIGSPIYIVNGKPIRHEDLQKIKAEDIKSVVVKATNRIPGTLIVEKTP
ncbi:M56 family metallopeptidase [Pedobacter sp. Du54]|uniref:M56 family metallopeptidase n=1 Tax=Pedobacter anseongensis TaxID=3133439 RepID=UPI00309CE22E